MRSFRTLKYLSVVMFFLFAAGINNALAETASWFYPSMSWLRGPVERFDFGTAHSVIRLLKKAVRGDEQSRANLIQLHSGFTKNQSRGFRLDERIVGLWEELPGLSKSSDNVNRLGLMLEKKLTSNSEGVLVLAVDPGYQPGGIRIFPGDRILTINELSVASASDVIRLIRANPSDQAIRLTINNRVASREVTVTPRSQATPYRSGMAYAVLFESAVVLEELFRSGHEPSAQFVIDLLTVIDFHSSALNDSEWARGTRIAMLQCYDRLIRSFGTGIQNGSLEWNQGVERIMGRILLKAHFLTKMHLSAKDSDVTWPLWGNGYSGAVRLLELLQRTHGIANVSRDAFFVRSVTATYDSPFLYDRPTPESPDRQLGQASGAISIFNQYANARLYAYEELVPLIHQLEYVAQSQPLRFLEKTQWSELHMDPRDWRAVSIKRFFSSLAKAYFLLLRKHRLDTKSIDASVHQLGEGVDQEVAQGRLKNIEAFHRRMSNFLQNNPLEINEENEIGWNLFTAELQLGRAIFWIKSDAIERKIKKAKSMGDHEQVLLHQKENVTLVKERFGVSDRLTVLTIKSLIHNLAAAQRFGEARAYIEQIRPQYKDPKIRLENEIEWARLLNEHLHAIALIEQYRDTYAPNLAAENFTLAEDLLLSLFEHDPQKLKSADISILIETMRVEITDSATGWMPGEPAPTTESDRKANDVLKRDALAFLDLVEGVATGDLHKINSAMMDLSPMMTAQVDEKGLINPYYQNLAVTIPMLLYSVGQGKTARSFAEKAVNLFENKGPRYAGQLAAVSILLSFDLLTAGDVSESERYLQKAIDVFSNTSKLSLDDKTSEVGLRANAVILNMAINGRTDPLAAIETAEHDLQLLIENATDLPDQLAEPFRDLMGVKPAIDVAASKFSVSRQTLRNTFLNAVFALDSRLFLTYGDGKLRNEVSEKYRNGDMRLGFLYAMISHDLGNYQEAAQVSETVLPYLAKEYKSLLSGVDEQRLDHTDRSARLVHAYAASLIKLGKYRKAFRVIDTFKGAILASTVSVEEQVLVSTGSVADIRVARKLKAELEERDARHQITINEQGKTGDFSIQSTKMIEALRASESLHKRLTQESSEFIDPYSVAAITKPIEMLGQEDPDGFVFLHYFKVGSHLWFSSFADGKYSGGMLDYFVNSEDQLAQMSALSTRGKRGFVKESTKSSITPDKKGKSLAGLIPLEVLRNKNIRRLYISTDSTTARIPFSAIGIGADYLVDRYDIGFAPSLRSIHLFRNRKDLLSGGRSMELLGVGVSDFSRYNLVHGDKFENLANTEKEIMAVKELFSGESVTTLIGPNATEEKLFEENKKGNLNDYRYVLFSTHGVASDALGANSYLVLNPSEPDASEFDGRFSLTEIAKLDLGADVVFLSACETGLGQTRLSEGTMGLPYAFLLAGGSSVVASLWKIDDNATRLFVTEFFRILRSDPERNTIAALSETKRAFANGRFPGYTDPAYWSAFVIYGGL